MTTIREMAPSDASDIADLSAELGYPTEPEVMRGRIARIGAGNNHLILVADVDGSAAGWLHAEATEALESGSRVEIVGLVVGEKFRRRGVGARLVARAEEWASKRGVESVVVRSNEKRTESHSFYPALGYSKSKTQAVYRKRV